MANMHEVMQEINGIHDATRKKYLNELAEFTGNDVIIYSSDCKHSGCGIEDDDIYFFMSALHGLKSNNLDLIIHSPGGSAEATEQLVNYLRSKYQYIRAIIPLKAMSAATMLACACDEIVMGKHSAIGPIDPQLVLKDRLIAAQAVIDEFETAKNELAKNPQSAVFWAPLITELPFGFLEHCNKIIKYSQLLVETWLKTWMLKDNPKSAEEIAEFLGQASNHNTHGRPINYSNPNIKALHITLLEDNHDFQEKVLSLFHASIMTHNMAPPVIKFIENQKGKGLFKSA